MRNEVVGVKEIPWKKGNSKRVHLAATLSREGLDSESYHFNKNEEHKDTRIFVQLKEKMPET